MAVSSLPGVSGKSVGVRFDRSSFAYAVRRMMSKGRVIDRFEYFTAPVGDNRAFDIVQDMYNWAVRAQLRPGAPFFSHRGEWTLSYNVLSKAIKKVASCMGLDPICFVLICYALEEHPC